jgi:hypothetical protein
MTKRNPWANWAVAMVAASGLLASLAVAPTAMANALSNTFQPGVANAIEDVSGEDYIPGATNTACITGSPSCTIQPGDVFLAVINFQSNQQTGAPYGAPNTPQLTGVFAVQVMTSTVTGTVNLGSGAVPTTNLTFSPFDVNTAILTCDAVGGACHGPGLALPLVSVGAGTFDANTFGYIFSGPPTLTGTNGHAITYVNSTGLGTPTSPTQADVMSQISSGSQIFSLDLTNSASNNCNGGTGNCLGENGVPDNPFAFLGATNNPSTSVGAILSGSNVSIFYQNTPALDGLTFQKTVQFKNETLSTPDAVCTLPSPPAGACPIYHIDDEVTVSLTPIAPIPEPTSLVLLGSSLLGLGAYIRRRRSMQA